MESVRRVHRRESHQGQIVLLRRRATYSPHRQRIRSYDGTNGGGGAFNTNQWDTRWDYYLDEKNTFFGRYSYTGFTIQAPGAFGLLAGGPSFNNIGYAGSSDVLNQSLAAGWTHTVNPTLVNELRFGYMRYRVNAVPNGVGTSPAKDAGIPGLTLDSYFTSGMPAFFINGDQNGNGNSSLGYALNINSCNCPLAQREQQYQVVDNLSKMLGNHNIKVGADIRYALNLRVPSDAHRAGELTFGPSYTGLVTGTGVTQGYGLASFLLGETTAFRRYVSSNTDAQERQKCWAFYGQDAWRASPKLTITYGLRWEMAFPETVNAPGHGSTLDLSTGDLDVFGKGKISDHGIQNMNWHIFAPRLGIAYQLTPKTVVRMGTGVSYSMGTFGSIFGHNVTQNLPVLAIQSLNASQAFSGVFNLAQGRFRRTSRRPMRTE
ncbi:MAG: TonB-dependent receptor [Acidobacteriota bacterium]|nr:TonB-dependent receptor [Acidobacteriota bacterium]